MKNNMLLAGLASGIIALSYAMPASSASMLPQRVFTGEVTFNSATKLCSATATNALRNKTISIKSSTKSFTTSIVEQANECFRAADFGLRSQIVSLGSGPFQLTLKNKFL